MKNDDIYGLFSASFMSDFPSMSKCFEYLQKRTKYFFQILNPKILLAIFND